MCLNSIKKLFFVLIICLSFNVYGQSHEKEPCVIVIFGATGDLTSRKLFPAFNNLAKEGLLADETVIIGVGRRENTHEIFREEIRIASPELSSSKIFYHQLNFDQESGYASLRQFLSQIDEEFGTKGNRLFYLATQPSYFSTIISNLDTQKLIYEPNDTSWSRVIIEKPFGTNLETALALQKDISEHLHESQIYRIDHYLGKEGVQNIQKLRFENGLFEPLWNNKHIDHIQITVSEDIGIGTRANFWEETGYLRDFFQNHLMQVLALVAMEQPQDDSAASVHQAKTKVLNDIRPFPSDRMENFIIRGQYGPGKIKNQDVLGYKQENGVPANSSVESFIAAKLFIDNERWTGVPFYIRGGKRLNRQTAEIAITFKNISEPLFIRIQPNPAIFFKGSKLENPGFNPKPLDAYEKLIYDCIQGDSRLFVRADEQIASWNLLTPVLDLWKSEKANPPLEYPAGSWGPFEADLLLKEEGHTWQLF